MKRYILFSFLVSGLCFGQQLTTDSDGKISAERQFSGTMNDTEADFNPEELDLDWSEPDFNVSDHPDDDSWDPRFTVSPEGGVYVVYNDDRPEGLQKIMFRKQEEGEWSDAFNVDTGGEIGERNNHFPAIQRAPNGDLHVVYNVWAYENVRNYLGYSHYDAASGEWSEGEKISDLNGTINHFNGHHEIYIDPEGRPVVFWGFDYRANEVNEEIYMTYFDGENWSADIPVSDTEDDTNAGFPYVGDLGNGKALVLYSEGSGNLKYRIYDSATHELSTPQTVDDYFPGAPYVLTADGEGLARILTIRKAAGPDRDVLNLFEYDSDNEVFTLSDNQFEIESNAGGIGKRIAINCKNDDDCGVIFTDFDNQTLSYLPYEEENGFGNALIIANQDPQLDPPHARFDSAGNLHVIWSDLRNDGGGTYIDREVIYKKGSATTMGLIDFTAVQAEIYPNPTSGNFTISTTESLEVEILDIAGRRVDSFEINGTTELRKGLAAGVYFVKMKGENGILIKKLLVK